MQKYIIIPALSEASAWEFTVPKNAILNHEMYNAVEEANYKVGKYIRLDQLKELLEESKKELN